MDDVAERSWWSRREAASGGDWPRAYGLFVGADECPGFRWTISGFSPKPRTPPATSS